MRDPIAVTVIGGYLGAGKTTLVNHILRTADERIAVVVNDFGDIDIDVDLIDAQDGETISLSNGCICCSLADGLAAALSRVLEFEPRPERLVVEASGVADPASVAAYAHSQGLALDAVIVMTDSETVRVRSQDPYVGDTVRSQLRSADVLVLNKVDLIEGSEADATREWLREQNPTAVLVDAVQSGVAGAVLFGGGRADGVRDDARHVHTGHGETDQRAEQVYQSWSWIGTRPVPRSTIEELMDELPESIVRAKGVLSLTDAPAHAMILQRVGRRWTLRRRAGPTLAPGDSRLVVIGMRGAIDDTWLTDRLSS